MTRIRAPSNPDGGQGILRGTVSLADGSNCWYESELFDMKEAARVDLVSSLGVVLQSVRANDHGQYVLTSVPFTFVQVRARCGALVVRKGVSPTTTDYTGGAPLDFAMSNREPRVVTVVPYLAGVGVHRVGAGATVTVVAEATDADGDPLVYTWRAPDPASVVGPSTTSSVLWTVPATPGRHSLYVLARDKKGGYADYRLTLPVEVGRVLFSGRVLGSDGPPIAGALVRVNGGSATTTTSGVFTLEIPAADRYNLYIEAQRYAELGRSLQAPATGATWVLTRAYEQLIDPSVDNVIVDGRKDWIYGHRKEPRRPARLTLFANTLVDEQGLLAEPTNGPFSAYITTYTEFP